MSKTITIDPVTRIEGHAKITLQLGDDGEGSEARFHVTHAPWGRHPIPMRKAGEER
jgi:coenzyme F420-reducing hydrogenase alpha subunit